MDIQKFFDDLKAKEESEVPADIFAAPSQAQHPTGEEPRIPEKDGEDDGERKNRRHRRLEKQLEAERQFNIAQAQRIQELTAQKAPAAAAGSEEMPREWVELYGDTPEAVRAWKVNEQMLKSYAEKAKSDALAEFENRQKAEAEERRKAMEHIDSQLETIEDEYNVDLTSDSPAARKSRNEFLDLVQKLSPKDANGNIIGYADFDTTFQTYVATKQSKAPANNRNKEIASKSMQSSQPTASEASRKTPGFFGWQTDLKI